ncbi:MAG: hypothetical protein LBJ90_09070 [Treponema sp.]|jgi:tetratricopeptide (TPR) repeat protein|nr:hypothetical protein [Treponema sp.]
MFRILFFLRYKNQLRRTRPRLISGLDDVIEGALKNAGGKIIEERRLLAAVFDEKTLSFWLDILIVIETVMRNLEAAPSEFYGYSLVLGRDLPAGAEPLCRFLAGGPRAGGVFVDAAAKRGLAPYAFFEGLQSWPEEDRKKRYDLEDYSRLTEFRNFPPAPGIFPLRETILRALRQGHKRNTLLLGRRFIGKREGLYRYCEEISPKNDGGNAAPEAGEKRSMFFPPLAVRFDSFGINALTDALSPRISALLGKTGAVSGPAELEELHDFLFRERLRDELPEYYVRKMRRFFTLLLEEYIEAAGKRRALPVLVLENLQCAGETARGICIDAYTAVKGSRELLVLGTCTEVSGEWEAVFPRVIKLNARKIPVRDPAGLPPDLREMLYALYLFGACFPGNMLRQLFEEEGKSPALFSKALFLLCALGAIDSFEDPKPRAGDLAGYTEHIPGELKNRIRAMVRGRLLAWTGRNKLNPCFNLLKKLAELGGPAEDQLVLKALSSDLIGGASSAFETACASGLPENLTGSGRAPVIRYIFKTTEALLRSDAEGIRKAFKEPPPDCSAFPVLKAQVLVNLSCCHLGMRDISSALETVKDAILQSQGKNNFCLSQSYRLFSLVNLSRQQTGETLDYISFAAENAEKTGSLHELAISAYYAAAAQFLYGNVSRAERLARQARDHALAAGRPDWADRSRFLEGRLAFETGRYREALEIFEALRKEPYGAALPEKERLLSAWVYRARVYFQNPLIQKPSDGGNDADLFEVEAAFLAGNFKRSSELAGLLSNPHMKENFLFTEQPDWRSGFAQCELLCFSRGELWDRMICVYRSLALCRISPAGGEEALHNMQRILRDEKLSEMDPWDSFYFYAWYRILEQTGAGQVDMNTAVSIAFKRLQRRASRIDDIETRRRYLSQPRWNSALSAAAKEFKLI